ncbi:MAG: DUF924 family protein [Enterobacterales bacterium]|nr:DUF924 family protein [Enterobacterales bacterium]
MQYSELLTFWFEEIDSSFWFKKDDDFDQGLIDRFLVLHQAAMANELFTWRTTIEGRLAEIILLDQFSRNMFRDSAQAFASDSLSLCLAQQAVALNLDSELDARQRSFLYMPYMHSESKIIHQQAEKLFAAPGLEANYAFELKHKTIIDEFGRYPHRNKLLGRQSTKAEIEFLKQSGSSF